MHYYASDEKIFTSKIKALEYQAKSGKNISFYYHDDIYSRVNWKLEPPETLDYYYKEQAQRLRDKYDYLILCYSGGYDSTNILETFYYNNIKLDKIVMVGALSQDSSSGVDENRNADLYRNAFPYLKEFNLESISQVCDYTTLFHNANNFSISKYEQDWIHHIGGWFSPHNWFWRDIEKHVVPKEWKDRKIGLIFGRDKPVLSFDKNPLKHIILKTGSYKLNGFAFRDNPCTDYGNELDCNNSDNVDRVGFYWDPEYPEILIKQLHLLNRIYSISLTNEYKSEIGSQFLSGINVNDIIYNLKKPLSFVSSKSSSVVFSVRDSYLNYNKNSDIFRFYNMGIREIKKMINIEIIKPIQSKFYEIV